MRSPIRRARLWILAMAHENFLPEVSFTRLLERRISLPICHATYGLICGIQRDRAG